MKNKGVIVSLIIILAIIIIGLIVFLYLSLSGQFDLKFNYMSFNFKKSDNIIFDTSYEENLVENLEILSAAGDVKFEESVDEKIRIIAYGESDENIRVDLENGKLKIDYSNYKNSSFGFNFYTNDIIIYIPKDYDKEINLDLDYGDIEIIDLDNATINIKEDCGDVKVGNIKNLFVENDCGCVEVELISNKFSIDSDCGDIKINSIAINEDSYIKSSYGDVKIGETNDVYIDAKVDLGEVDIAQNNRYSETTLTIETDCGDIKIEN